MYTNLDPALGPTQPPIKWLPGLPPGGKAAGSSVDHRTTSSAEVKERRALYIFSLSRSYCLLLGELHSQRSLIYVIYSMSLATKIQ